MMSQQQMPYPAYLQNDLSTILTFVLPLFTVLSFAFIGIMHTNHMTQSSPHLSPLSIFINFIIKIPPKIF
jgi:hypothetical protein